MCPFRPGLTIVLRHVADVDVGGGIECGADVGDLDVRGVARCGTEVDVDGGDERVGDEGYVLHVALVEIEGGVDPDAGVVAVRDGEDGVLLVAGGLREDEVRIPSAAGGPAALALGSEEGCGLCRWDWEIELEGRAELDGLWVLGGARRGDEDDDRENKG